MALRAKGCTYAYRQEFEVFPVLHKTSGGLKCPHCGSDYTHQKEARVLWRPEDGDGTCYSSSHTKEAKEFIKSDDLPGRRDFMEIDFDCEMCERKITLYIQQHKGQTYMGWVK